MLNHSKILVVDDEAIARDNLTHVLSKEGYGVTAVETGDKALQELEKQDYDLVLTDLMMPGIDGLQVLERSKEMRPPIQVIVITGHASVATAVAAMQKGAHSYLAKPFNLDRKSVV